MKRRNKMFKPEDVISTYTDAQACDDGVLVALNPKDRVTRTVWEWLVKKAPKTSKPPDRWPVEMMGWFRATAISKLEAAKLIAKHGKDAQPLFERIVADRKAAALSRGLITTNRQRAAEIYNENIEGGILRIFVQIKGDDLEDGELEGITECGSLINTTLWILPNENDGMTLMFPEDY
jgi:hypothetical protein